MSKRSSVTTPNLSQAPTGGSTPEAPDPPYIRSCADACDEAVFRINFVYEMLHAVEEPQEEDPGGYEFHMIREALGAIQTMLRDSSAASSKTEGAR
jgi:hypothetical protein